MCHMEADPILPDTLGNYWLMTVTWDNAGTSTYDVHKGFQSRQETCCGEDLEDAYKSF
uniref:Uncharacterized protein n=1 Tax=Arion vulgaris TaxID=1028688 RepID=A0A0B7BSQ8_9EUPU